MSIIISRQQRQVLYEHLLVDVSAVGDIYLKVEAGDYGTARRYRLECEDSMRLLDDLGWDPEPVREKFELTVPPEQLTRVISRIHARATEAAYEHVRRPLEEAESAERDIIAAQACAEVLSHVAHGGPPAGGA